MDSATGRKTRVRARAHGGRDQFCVADTMQGAGAFDTLEANARLIAAAPDMLEALREFIGAVDAGTTFADASALDAARAAIAKATGQKGGVWNPVWDTL